MLYIREEKINIFLENLKKKFEVFSLPEKENHSGDSFKKYFFPPNEEILPLPKPPKKFILFGLDLMDLEALTYLDEIMTKPKEDFYYWQRRNQAVVIGLIEEKIDAMPGGDVVFEKIGGGYRVWFENKKAKKIIDENKDFFEDLKDTENSSTSQNEDKSIEVNSDDWQKLMRQLLLDPELLANAVEWSWKNYPKIWDELGQKCLGCGVCTYVCPLCHCFSMGDTISLDDRCSRCRKWDACTLPNFSKVAGGHNFHPTIKERYYNWFYHKFVRAYKEYGKSQCVGCKRCKIQCPAGIDILEVLKEILREYQNNKS